MTQASRGRLDRILKESIEVHHLNLAGLTVLTEAASGPYLHTPILAALAGADQVHAVTADSRYGSKERVKQETLQAAARWGVDSRIEVFFEKRPHCIAESDLVTNTGFVRPIDRDMIAQLKPTAVVALMWETWEYRPDEIDLAACKEHGVLVLGTVESRPPVEMYPYSGYCAMKMLFELGLEGYRTRTLLLGGQQGLAASIYRHFRQLDMEVTWFSDADTQSRPYKELRSHFMQAGAAYDALLVAEHADPIRLLGSDGLLTYDELQQINPAIRIGMIAGNVEIAGLKRSGLHYFPEAIQDFGYLSYQPYHLGPRPILELYAAGLAVGQAMSAARRAGMAVVDAASYAIQHSPAMDFLGDDAWLQQGSE